MNRYDAPQRSNLTQNHNSYPYPPNVAYNDDSVSSLSTFGKSKSVVVTVETVDPEDPRHVGTGTPSPTPSEQKELKSGAINWKSMGNWRFWFRREWLWYYVAVVIILVITILVTVFHKQIVHTLEPATRWLHDLKFGWLVPIGVLFVISFPPLFGHEIVAILCGLVWGLGPGFGIVAAGTFLGEVGNFYAFKYCCRSRGEKLEKTNMSYSCLATVVREGGFKVALIARLSAIPGHFTTAVFSTCGMGIIVFSIAAVLSLPKQLMTVYLGVILEQSDTGVTDTRSRIVSDVVLAVTILITIVAMWYILHEMNKVKPQVIYARRKARQAKLSRAGVSPYLSGNAISDSTVVFNPQLSESDIPLRDQTDFPYQRWDKHGKAVGFAPNPNLVHAPKPRRPISISDGTAVTQPLARAREDSTDDIAWDMDSRGGAKYKSSDDPYGGLEEQPSGSTYPMTQVAPSDIESASGAPPHVSSKNEGTHQGSISTRAAYNHDWDQFSTTETYYDPYSHGQELTEASYRTAASRSPVYIDNIRTTSPNGFLQQGQSYDHGIR